MQHGQPRVLLLGTTDEKTRRSECAREFGLFSVIYAAI